MLRLVPNSATPSDVVIPIERHGSSLNTLRCESRKSEILFCVKVNAFVDGMMAEEIIEDRVVKGCECLTFV